MTFVVFLFLASSTITSPSDQLNSATTAPSSDTTQTPSLEAQQMLLQAMLNKNLNQLFTDPPTASGNTAIYSANVRQAGYLVAGRYQLNNVPNDAYSSTICNYYDTSDNLIRSQQTYSKPAYCIVDQTLPFVQKLKMLVNGIFEPPLTGQLTVEDKVLLPQSASDVTGVSADGSLICLKTRVDSSSTSNLQQIPQYSNAGSLVWRITLPTNGGYPAVIIRNVYVTSDSSDVLRVSVTPFYQVNGQLYPLNTVNGLAGTEITGFPTSSSGNIDNVLVKMDSILLTTPDPSSVSVSIEYCTQAPPNLNNMQQYYAPYYLQQIGIQSFI